MTTFATITIGLLLAGLSTVNVAWAGPEEEACAAELAAARVHVATLPAGDLSRRFAENVLDTAQTELNSGEVDECAPAIAQVRWIVRTRPYVLRPGETFGIQGRAP